MAVGEAGEGEGQRQQQPEGGVERELGEQRVVVAGAGDPSR